MRRAWGGSALDSPRCRESGGWWAALLSLLRVAAGVGVGLPLVMMPYLYLAQEAMIFPSPRYAPDLLASVRRVFGEAREVYLSAAAEVVLHGWHLSPAERAALATAGEGGRRRSSWEGEGRPGQPAPLLFYFGGNGELAADFLWEAEQLPPAWGVVSMDYRGYGLSQGKPAEAALCDDAVRLFDHWSDQPGVDPTRVVAMGRSLGSGVAVALAARRPLRGVVLVTPFASLTQLAQERYPYLPVAWLLRHPFDSRARAPAVAAPALLLAAGEDDLVPPRHAEALAAAWGGPRQLRRLDGLGHDTIQEGAAYWPAISAFLRSLE